VVGGGVSLAYPAHHRYLTRVWFVHALRSAWFDTQDRDLDWLTEEKARLAKEPIVTNRDMALRLVVDARLEGVTLESLVEREEEAYRDRPEG